MQHRTTLKFLLFPSSSSSSAQPTLSASAATGTLQASQDAQQAAMASSQRPSLHEGSQPQSSSSASSSSSSSSGQLATASEPKTQTAVPSCAPTSATATFASSGQVFSDQATMAPTASASASSSSISNKERSAFAVSAEKTLRKLIKKGDFEQVKQFVRPECNFDKNL